MAIWPEASEPEKKGGGRMAEIPFNEIADLFSRGMVRWLKVRYPILYGEMIGLVKAINEASEAEDEDEFEDLVQRYKAFVLKLRQEFDEGKGKRGRVNQS